MCTVPEAEAARLAALGINTVQAVRTAGGPRMALRTLAGPGAASPDWRLLGQRRLALFILTTVERGTRWMLFEPNEPGLWVRASRQLRGFFGALEEEGAFAGRAPEDRWFVVCDERINRAYERDRGIINVLFGFAASRPGQFHSFLISHRAGGSRVKTVSLNGLQAAWTRTELALEDLAEEPFVKAG
jgi:phage tail sheath protein FI